MKFDQLIILLPCLSLEEFGLRRSPDEAQELLACWSAMWHPALLAGAERVPSWAPAEQPPAEPDGHLLMLPACSVARLPEGWLAKAEAANAYVVRGIRDRQQIVAAVLQRLSPDAPEVDPQLVADFLALGTCHFMVELLTRQLRYMSNLDEESFRSAAVGAADQATRGDVDAARDGLRSAFELLHEARDYFYPVEAHLLDLTIVAPTTLGESLQAELAGRLPSNLLISGKVVERIARQEPAMLQRLAEALSKNTTAIVGGEFDEPPLPLLSPEAILHHLGRGLEAYQKHLGTRPTVFGRRRFGLTPALPAILKKLGFVGALHSTLDDGRFPTGNQSRIQWEGLDGTIMETLGRVPADISRADAFLRMPERLGDSMDLDHVATVVLAHWPGRSSPWYDDLKRIASYSPVMGTFARIDDYFRDTGYAGQRTLYRADQYRSPYLKQAVAGRLPDPISRWVRYHCRRATAEACQSLDSLAALVTGRLPKPQSGGQRRPTAEQLLAEVEASLSAEGSHEDPDPRLQRGLESSLACLAQSLASANHPGQTGYLVANPLSFSRRVCLTTPDLADPPALSGPVRAAGQSAGNKMLVVDVPAMGFAWVGSHSEAVWPGEPAETTGRNGPGRGRQEPPLVEENVLRNEFFEVTVDPHTGAIRSIADYYSRGPRLAQQIALRTARAGCREPGDDVHYTIMAAEELRVASRGPILGEIVARGRLVDREGKRVAGFQQTTRVRRGSRIIELQIELDCQRLPDPDPWQSYYAARFAWADATANLYRSVNEANLPSQAVQLETPHFIDVRAGRVRTTLLTGGLPYHRRLGVRKLDTLLVVHGETARSFRLGIGIDVSHPMHAALDFLAPETVLPGVPSPPAQSAWLFHLDARNVISTSWTPLASGGRVEGFRVRLLETDGRKVDLALRCFRRVASAGKILPGDAPPEPLSIEGDCVTVAIRAHEWAEVEARFAG